MWQSVVESHILLRAAHAWEPRRSCWNWPPGGPAGPHAAASDQTEVPWTLLPLLAPGGRSPAGTITPHRGASAVCSRLMGPNREGLSFPTQVGDAHVTGVQSLHREEREPLVPGKDRVRKQNAPLGSRHLLEKSVRPGSEDSLLRTCGFSRGGSQGSLKF